MPVTHTSTVAVLSMLLGICFAPVCSRAQASYQTQQSLHPNPNHVWRDERLFLPADKRSALHSRFLGWKTASAQGPQVVQYFVGLAQRKQPTVRLRSTYPPTVPIQPVSRRISALPSGSVLPGLGLRPSLPAGIMPTAVVVGDFNKDGKLDWAIANGGDSTLYIYLGNGDGTAKPPTIISLAGKSPVGLAVGDLNGDGDLDLAVAEADSQGVGILLGNGDGTFKTETLLPGFAVSTTAVAVLDVNNDGFPDLVVGLLGDSTGPVNSGFAVFLNNGTANFGTPMYAPNDPSVENPSAQEFSGADVNRDGHIDLLVTSVSAWNGGQLSGGRTQIFTGKGDGTFTAGQVLDSSNEGGLLPRVVQNAALADVDGDGCLDAVVVDSYGDGVVYLGDCNGGFNTNVSAALVYGMGDDTYGLVVADINGDGHPDIITAGVPLPQDTITAAGVATGNMLGVRLNDGTGHFGPLHVFLGEPGMFSLAVGDLSNDGLPDIISANQNANSATVFVNKVSGDFGSPSGGYDGEFEGNITGFFNPPKSGFLAADVNGDGLPDLALIEDQDSSTNLLQLVVMLNQGNGQFGMPVRTPAFRSDYIVGDFAFGNFRDLRHNDFVGVAFDDSTGCGQPQLLYAPNTGNGSFGSPVQISLTLANPCDAFPILAVGDFDHDGKLDFAVLSLTGPSTSQLQVSTFLGNGDGTFQSANQKSFSVASGPAPQAAFVEDADGDGKLDLLVWLSDNGYGPGTAGKDLLEFLGNGDGTFQRPKNVIQNLYAMTMRDLNHDGRLDAININSGSDQSDDTPGTAPAVVTTYLGNSDGSFTLKSTSSPFLGYLDPFFGNTASTAPSDFSVYPYVGDFNGDGTPDIAVYQRTQGLGPAYAQFLVGNGDGTFTPTYNVYPLSTFRAPDLVAENIFGDGRAAAIYAPNYPASYSIVPAIVAPSIQADILETPVLSGRDSVQISLNVPSSSATSVMLSASDSGVQVPPSATIPANTLEVEVPFTLSSTFPHNQWFRITAEVNSSTAVAYSYSPPLGEADPFSLAVYGGFPSGVGSSPAPGQTSAWDAIASTASMASSTFQLSCKNLPTGTTCDSFAPPNLSVSPAGTAATDFTITPATSLAPGSYPFTVSATDGYVTVSGPATLRVGDFGLSVAPTSLTTQATSTAKFTVNIDDLFGYAQSVDLSCSGLPSGASCTFPNSSALELQLDQVPVGTYSITVTGTSNSLLHTAAVKLQVISTPVIAFNPDKIVIAPAVVGGTSSQNASLSNSGSAPLTISNIAISGSGTNGTLSTSDTCSGSISPGASCTVTTTFAATSVGVFSGTLTVSDNASGSPQTLPVTAQGVDFSIDAASGESTSATVTAGQSAIFSLEIVPDQFQGLISLQCTTPPPLSTCTVESNISITGNLPSTFQVTARTTASTSQGLTVDSNFRPNWHLLIAFCVMVLAFFLIVSKLEPVDVRYRSTVRASLCFWLTLAAILSSCGGRTSGGGGGNNGTPSGTYTLTINATAGGVTHSLPLQLTVH